MKLPLNKCFIWVKFKAIKQISYNILYVFENNLNYPKFSISIDFNLMLQIVIISHSVMDN